MPNKDEGDTPDAIKRDIENIPESAKAEANEVEVKGRTVEIYDFKGDPEKDLIILRDHRDGLQQRQLKLYWKIIEGAKEKYYEDYESEEFNIIEREKERVKEKYVKKLKKIEEKLVKPVQDVMDEIDSF